MAPRGGISNTTAVWSSSSLCASGLNWSVWPGPTTAARNSCLSHCINARGRGTRDRSHSSGTASDAMMPSTVDRTLPRFRKERGHSSLPGAPAGLVGWMAGPATSWDGRASDACRGVWDSTGDCQSRKSRAGARQASPLPCCTADDLASRPEPTLASRAGGRPIPLAAAATR